MTAEESKPTVEETDEFQDEPQAEEPDESQAEEPDEPQAEEPDEPQDEEPEEPQAEEPDESQAEEPDESQAEEPDESQDEEPDESQDEEPDEAQDEEPDEAQAEEPDEAQAGEPDESQAGEPDESQAGETDEAQAEEPEVSAVAEESAEAQTEEQTEAQDEEPKELKMVLHVKDGRANAAVWRSGADPHLETFPETSNLEDLLPKLPGMIERANARWAESPMRPSYTPPKAPKKTPAKKTPAKSKTTGPPKRARLKRAPPKQGATKAEAGPEAREAQQHPTGEPAAGAHSDQHAQTVLTPESPAPPRLDGDWGGATGRSEIRAGLRPDPRSPQHRKPHEKGPTRPMAPKTAGLLRITPDEAANTPRSPHAGNQKTKEG